MALVSLLPSCDLTEKLALLHLFALISNNMPTVRINHGEFSVMFCKIS